mmetsp:Transcript_60393/g.178866  ORF Transcript_60393/g.178866 Transcript_60393/m.178866 type:complete len:352 (+) Transcript_60393:179-1234(+)
MVRLCSDLEIRNSKLETHPMILIHKGQCVSRHLHPEEARRIRRERADERRPHPLEQCRRTLLLHQMRVHIVHAVILPLRSRLESALEDVGRDGDAPARHPRQSSRGKYRRRRQLARARIDPLNPHQFPLGQFVDTEPRHAPRPVPGQRREGSPVQAPHAPRPQQIFPAIHHAPVPRLSPRGDLVRLHLKEALDPFGRRRDGRGGDGAQPSRRDQLGYGKCVRRSAAAHGNVIRSRSRSLFVEVLDRSLPDVVPPETQREDGRDGDEGGRHAAVQSRDALLPEGIAEQRYRGGLHRGRRRLNPYLDEIERMADEDDADSSDSAREEGLEGGGFGLIHLGGRSLLHRRRSRGR